MRHLIVHTAYSYSMNEFQSFQIGSISCHYVWCQFKFYFLPFLHVLEAAGEYDGLEKGNSNTASTSILNTSINTSIFL